MNQLLDHGRFEHSMPSRQKVEMHVGITFRELLQFLAICSWDDSVVSSKGEVHSSGPRLQFVGDFLMCWPAKPMSTPSVPDHHAHAVTRDVKRTETMQMRRNDAFFKQQVTAADHSISMPINPEPN